jgi:hypothetical protein
MISIRDAAGHIEFCNSRWREYRGILGNGPITHDWKSGIPPEYVDALRPPNSKNGHLRPWEGECRIRRASDGALRWHRVRVIPLRDASDIPTRWLAIASDIHERKEAEQERERLVLQLQRERSEIAVQYAIVRVLASSTSLSTAGLRLLSTLCGQLGWSAGALWTIGPSGSRQVLTLVNVLQNSGLAPIHLLQRTKAPPLKKNQCLAGRVWATKGPLHLSGLSQKRGPALYRAAAVLGLQSAFAFPIILAGEVRGVIELFTRDAFEPSQTLLDIVTAVGIQIGLFIQRTQALERLRHSEEALIQVNNALEKRVEERTVELHEANRELSAEILERTRLEREIIQISEREQRRIGQDLHDGLCQELAAIAFMTHALATRMGRIGAEETARIQQVARLLNDSITRCRDIARGLHPVEMDADGLMVALHDLAHRTHPTVACSFLCHERILMPESDTALNLYRIAQEAVNNAIKYARATRITISLSRQAANLSLAIYDDGRGIPARPARARRSRRDGMGLHIMRYRARAMGATLRIRDRHPHGTEVLCLLPRK